jgi:phosphonate transport system substrate-binding protein
MSRVEDRVMKLLKIASCMAENTEPFCRALARYFQNKIGIETEYVSGIPWQERERMFDAGEIQMLWLCGLPYVHKAELLRTRVELLAVPVPIGRRYENRPVYFSEVVVHRQSAYRCFSDLRGRVWAFNEPRSHSGYNVVRAHLAGLGAYAGYFASAVESGAHVNSLRMILDRRVDCAAIDSTVLEWAAQEQPEISEHLRVIETLGPSPIPPWVISKSVPVHRRRTIRALLLDMHRGPFGMVALNEGRIARFVASNDHDYDPIRRMAQAAAAVAVQPA